MTNQPAKQLQLTKSSKNSNLVRVSAAYAFHVTIILTNSMSQAEEAINFTWKINN